MRLTLGHASFDARKEHGQRLGLRHSTICAVVRVPDDPRRPSGYRPLDEFWTKQQYLPLKGVTANHSWAEIGAKGVETDHVLQFWMRDL